MRNNISRADLDAVIEFLRQDDPILTHAHQVREFEREWAQWLGVKHCVMVNSGSSANLITLAALREKFGGGEIIVPPLTWVSDVAAVLQCGFTPVFVDINPRTLGMDDAGILAAITPRTRAVFLTHILGYNALTRRVLDGLAERNIPLIEDVCESHGATFEGRRLGSFSLMSNFSFYYAHHLSTIEGGMICTDDAGFYEICRMFRSHGMVREASNPDVKQRYHREYPDLNADFIFAFPAYNMRSTEINAVLGRSQLKRLDANNDLRRRNLKIFLENLDRSRYRTDFATDGSCNYAFTLVLNHPDTELRDNVERTLREAKVEFRRGTSGGGNQMRQPYLKHLINREDFKRYPQVEHVHFFGYYIGNYPDLEPERILELCKVLNGIPAGAQWRNSAESRTTASVPSA
jgi:CDP-6-deoxy-D-xylo-4-hexulose-3-dehydrase